MTIEDHGQTRHNPLINTGLWPVETICKFTLNEGQAFDDEDMTPCFLVGEPNAQDRGVHCYTVVGMRAPNCPIVRDFIVAHRVREEDVIAKVAAMAAAIDRDEESFDVTVWEGDKLIGVVFNAPSILGPAVAVAFEMIDRTVGIVRARPLDLPGKAVGKSPLARPAAAKGGAA